MSEKMHTTVFSLKTGFSQNQNRKLILGFFAAFGSFYEYVKLSLLCLFYTAEGIEFHKHPLFVPQSFSYN